jgi:hypothetical protein
MQIETNRRDTAKLRRNFFLLSVLTIAVTFVATAACTTKVAPTVTLKPAAPILRSEGIYVIAALQRDRIIESLRKAGLNSTDSPNSAGYVLEVRQGNNRASKSCGTVNNISYVLSVASSRMMVIKGRGASGTCEPNIFDDMSRQLAGYTSQPAVSAQPSQPSETPETPEASDAPEASE